MKQARKRTVTKKELIEGVAREIRQPPGKVRVVVQEFLDAVVDSLSRGDRLEFREFGVFDIVHRKERVGRNPKKARVTIVIPPKNVVKFTPGKRMRAMVERENRDRP
jgi:integration host factor subunit beta